MDIRLASSKDLLSIEKISDEIFGEHYIESKGDLLEDNLTIVATVSEEVVGFAIASIVKHGGEERCGLSEIDAPYAILEMICVQSEFRRRGIGENLFDRRLKLLIQKGIKKLLLYHWVRKENEIPRFAVSSGFIKKGRIQNKWKEDSLKYGYGCSKCGSPPCLCAADLYILEVRTDLSENK